MRNIALHAVFSWLFLLAGATPDHAAFGRNRPNADNVIDSKSLKRALREKLESAFFASRALTPAGEAANVVIADLEFKPSIVSVRIGDTVTWINRDIVEHTATSRDGVFDVATPKSRPAHWRAQKVGDFSYYCRLHPNMAGIIRVTR